MIVIGQFIMNMIWRIRRQTKGITSMITMVLIIVIAKMTLSIITVRSNLSRRPYITYLSKLVENLPFISTEEWYPCAIKIGS